MKIAFGYKMGSGKDTSVEYMIGKFGGQKISFADPIYSIMTYAQKTCGFANEKDRKFLQWIGTEWGREKNSNIWIDIALGRSSTNENCFISDLRFQNEFDALKENGWTCVKLKREYDNISIAGTGIITHISENELDNIDDFKWDYIIENNGTFNDLYKKLDKLKI
jgi:hypothetical protein